MPSLLKDVSRHHSLNKRMAYLLKLLGALLVLQSLQMTAKAEETLQPTETEVKQAMKVLKQDPNLADEEKKNSLHWIKDEDKDKPDTKTPGWLRWLQHLFAWIAHTSRLLLWTVIGVMVAIVVVFLLRIFRGYQTAARAPVVHVPTHVRDMDIRPESLPADIGAAAWQLWQQQQHRAALSLLYRGLLSRLVHQYAVPIRDSTTERQCMELAQAQLQTAQTEYVSRMLGIWQVAIYGGKLPDTEQVQLLCTEFVNALDAKPIVEHAP
ncbi:MAG: DUF4129 domain-containing protein [Polaromonas sp.]|nr:DUF4129 domain-containing protein [Polaromonas sp.]